MIEYAITEIEGDRYRIDVNNETIATVHGYSNALFLVDENIQNELDGEAVVVVNLLNDRPTVVYDTREDDD